MKHNHNKFDEILDEFFLQLECTYKSYANSSIFLELETFHEIKSEDYSDDYKIERFIFTRYILQINFDHLRNLDQDRNTIISYVKNRIKQVNNPLGKALYLDALHSLEDCIHPFLNEALEHYYEALNRILNKDNYRRARWITKRISELSRKANNSDIIEKMFNRINEDFSKILYSKPVVVGAHIREIIMDVFHLLSEESIEELIKITEAYIKTLDSDPNLNSDKLKHRSDIYPKYILFLRKVKRNTLVTQNQKKYIQALKDVGEYYLRESDSNGALLAKIHFERALEKAIEFGLSKAEQDELKIKRSQAIDKFQYPEIITKQIIDSKNWVMDFKTTAKRRFPNLENPYLILFSLTHELIPDLEINLKEQSIVRQVFPTERMKGVDSRGRFNPHTERGMQNKVKEDLTQWTMISEIYYSFIFKELAKDELITFHDLIKFLSSNLRLDNAEQSFIMIGLEQYFDNQYVAAIHILLPRLERIIRNYFHEKEPALYKIIITKNGIETYQPIMTVIETQEAEKLFGKRFCEFFKANLYDSKYRNIRNDILHGIINLLDITDHMALLPIWIMLMLCDLFF